jgi:hypothetical protein
MARAASCVFSLYVGGGREVGEQGGRGEPGRATFKDAGVVKRPNGPREIRAPRAPPCAELRWRGGADHKGPRRSEYRDTREVDSWAPHVSQPRARVLEAGPRGVHP